MHTKSRQRELQVGGQQGAEFSGGGKGGTAKDQFVNINSAWKNFTGMKANKEKKTFVLFFFFRAAKFHSLKRTQKRRMSRWSVRLNDLDFFF